MASFIGNIKVLLGLETGQFSKGISTARKETSTLESSMNNFAKNMGGMIAGAFAVDALLSFSKEASDLAGKLTGVEAAFKKIDNGGLLNNLRAATKGTVSDLELMQNAVKAENLGLPVEQLGTYFEFARRTAKATGESVDFLVQSIVTGIGRKSPLILDNLGISTTQLNAQLEKTPDFATAVGIVIAEKMAKAGEDVDTAAERSAQFAAVWQNFKVGVGAAINDIITVIVDTFYELWQVLKDIVAPIGELMSAFNGLNGEFSIGEILGKSMMWMVKSLTLLLKPLVWMVRGVADGFKWLYQNSELVRTAFDYIKRGVNAVVNVFNHLGGIMLAVSNSFGHLWTAIKTMNFDGLGGKISGEFKKAFETKPIEKHTEAVKVAVKETKTLTAEQLKAIEELQKKRKDLYERWRKEDLNKAFLGTEEIKIDWNDFQLTGDKPKNLLAGLGDDIDLSGLDEELDGEFGKINQKAEKMRETFKSVAQSIKSFFETIAIEGLATFGAALGTAFAGGDVMQVGMQFAQVIADSIGALGKQLISIGVTMSGIMEGIKAFGWTNPALVIGGGIALVALSSAMKGMMAQPTMFANGGLVTGATLGMVGEGIGTTRSNPEVIAPLDKLRNFMPDSGGSSGNVNFRIEGNTLVGILDRQGKTSRYTR